MINLYNTYIDEELNNPVKKTLINQNSKIDKKCFDHDYFETKYLLYKKYLIKESYEKLGTIF
jgi:hypothetical protein